MSDNQEKLEGLLWALVFQMIAAVGPQLVEVLLKWLGSLGQDKSKAVAKSLGDALTNRTA